MLVAAQINHGENTISFIRDTGSDFTVSTYNAPVDLLNDIAETLLNHQELPYPVYPYGNIMVTNYVLMNSAHYIVPQFIYRALEGKVF